MNYDPLEDAIGRAQSEDWAKGQRRGRGVMNEGTFPQPWDVATSPRDAFFADNSIVISCDGHAIEDVVAYDVAKGWVLALCRDVLDGKFHRHPRYKDRVCERMYHGKVEITRKPAP